MRNPYLFVLIAASLFWGTVLFWGYVSSMGKFLKPPSFQPASNTPGLKNKQKAMMKEAKEQRKRAMEDYRQKIKDHERIKIQKYP